MNVTSLEVTLDIDTDPWRDLDGSPAAILERVCGIPRGTRYGNAAVGLAIRLEDGSTVVAQTTLQIFVEAAEALARHYKVDLS